MFIKEITIMSFENYFPLWNDLNTAQKKLISDHLITACEKRNNHSQREHGLYWIITG
mgnify:CR=1 FL=1